MVVNPSKLKPIFETAIVTLAVFSLLDWAFSKRSFEKMNEIARSEYLGYLSEYKVDSMGFVGPFLGYRNKSEVLFFWEKRKDDTTVARFKVIVPDSPFSNPAAGSDGSQEYWSTLRRPASRSLYGREK